MNSSTIQFPEVHCRIFLHRSAKELNDRTSKNKVEKWIVLRSHSVEIELAENADVFISSFSFFFPLFFTNSFLLFTRLPYFRSVANNFSLYQYNIPNELIRINSINVYFSERANVYLKKKITSNNNFLRKVNFKNLICRVMSFPRNFINVYRNII